MKDHGMLEQALARRNLPEIWPNQTEKPSLSSWETRRGELVDILSHHVYGRMPDPPPAMTIQVVRDEEKAFAGKARQREVKLSMDLPGGHFSFPVQYLLPNPKPEFPGANTAEKGNGTGYPLFIHIAFRPHLPDIYLPAEEIIDAGYALLNFCYEDITADCDDDFSSGLAQFSPDWLQRPDRWGKIGMWAWAASRVLDFAEREAADGAPLDLERVAVAGHSRLGKTALWAGANDPRFRIVISNDSGCAGAALERGGSGEDVRAITRRFGYWFTPAYAHYAGQPDKMPFDQHFLLAACLPRRIYVASAAEDAWADPDSEFLAALAAGELAQTLGLPGLVTEDRWPETDCMMIKGNIAYHRRPGSHFLSRNDWQRFIAFCNRQDLHQQEL